MFCLLSVSHVPSYHLALGGDPFIYMYEGKREVGGESQREEGGERQGEEGDRLTSMEIKRVLGLLGTLS